MEDLINFYSEISKTLDSINIIINRKINKFLCGIGVHHKIKYKVNEVPFIYWECKRCRKRDFTGDYNKYYLLDIVWLNNKNILYPMNPFKSKIRKLKVYSEVIRDEKKKVNKSLNKKRLTRLSRGNKRNLKMTKKY